MPSVVLFPWPWNSRWAPRGPAGGAFPRVLEIVFDRSPVRPRMTGDLGKSLDSSLEGELGWAQSLGIPGLIQESPSRDTRRWLDGAEERLPGGPTGKKHHRPGKILAGDPFLAFTTERRFPDRRQMGLFLREKGTLHWRLGREDLPCGVLHRTEKGRCPGKKLAGFLGKFSRRNLSFSQEPPRAGS